MERIRYSLFLLLMISVSCAQIKTLDGGAKDITPPKELSSSLSNATLNFKENTVTFAFNEYIALNDVQGQLIFSPQLKTFPEVTIKGKNLTISWKDTLLSNTTYQFDFGNSVVDNTEGNPVEVRRVFSTGNFMDSLQIFGKVRDAWTLENKQGAIVQLLKELPISGQTYQPLYQTKTDLKGNFGFQYLSNKAYYLLTFVDINGNGRWDEKENMDWSLEKFIPQVNPDSVQLMQAPALQSNSGFMQVSVDSCGWMSTFWDHRWQKPMITAKDSIGFNVEFKDDSLYILLSDHEKDGYFTFKIQDSLMSDSVGIPLFKEAFDKRNINLSASARCYNNDSIQFEINKSAEGCDFRKMKWMVEDSSYSVIGKWNKIDRILSLIPPVPNFQGLATLQLRPGCFFADDWMIGKDTSICEVEWLNKDQVGFLQLINVPQDLKNAQWTIESGKDSRLVGADQLSKGLLLIPGKYNISAWSDENRNGKWEGHDFNASQKSEKVLFRSKEINVRANWQEIIEMK